VSEQNPEQKPSGPPPTLWQVIGSVAAAMFGVQSNRNRERDFNRGRLWQFVVVGAGMVLLLVLVLILGVHFILAAAASGS
jgi:Protein of unknown function (DUF2970).